MSGLPYDTVINITVRDWEEMSSRIEGARDEDLSRFLTVCGALVFLMQAGFAFLEAGSVRTKNITNILMKNFLDSLVGAILFWAFGFAFAFGHADGGNGFVGNQFFFLTDLHPSNYNERDFFFQWTFAATAATITSGAVAGRTRFEAYITWAMFITSWIYPVIVHWVWSTSGMLAVGGDNLLDSLQVGMVDVAGSGVVHLCGGISGFLGAKFVGHRMYRWTKKWDGAGKGQLSPFRSMWTALGVFILWFGWYGFNGGGVTNGVTNVPIILGTVATNNTMAAGWAAVVCVLLHKFLRGNWDINVCMNGLLAGLVGITAGCAVLEVWGACVVGCIAGPVYYGLSGLIIKWEVDDPVDAFPIHAGCGAWGCIAVGLLSSEEKMAAVFGETHYGALMGSTGDLLGSQLLGVTLIACWTAFWGILYFGLAKKFNLLRVSEEEEKVGLDFFHHVEMTAVQKGLFKQKTSGSGTTNNSSKVSGTTDNE